MIGPLRATSHPWVSGRRVARAMIPVVLVCSALTASGKAASAAAGSAITKPGAPTAVTALSANTAVGVSWTPASSGGDAITGYTVTADPGGHTCATQSVVNCTVTGLTNGVHYNVTVRAANAKG